MNAVPIVIVHFDNFLPSYEINSLRKIGLDEIISIVLNKQLSYLELNGDRDTLIGFRFSTFGVGC
jgi:hypothetical protein